MRGWRAGSGRRLAELLVELPAVEALIVTQITTDGTLEGPDTELLAETLAITTTPLIASGGVAGIDDLTALAALRRAGRSLAGAHRGPRSVRTQARRGHGRGSAGEDRRAGGGGLVTSTVVRIIPCLDVDEGRVVKGVEFSTSATPRPDRVGRPLRHRGGRRVDLPRHHGLIRCAGRHGRGGPAEPPRRSSSPSPSGVGSAAPTTRDGCCAPGPTRCRSTPQPWHAPGLIAEIADEFGSQWWWWPSMPPPPKWPQTSQRLRGGHARGAKANRTRCGAVGAGGAAPGRGGDPADLDGSRRNAGGVRPAAHAGGERGGERAAHRLWGCGFSGTPRRRVRAGADAVLAASIFHFGQHTIAEAKSALGAAGVRVRPIAGSGAR